MTLKTILYIAFGIWSFPFAKYRLDFRRIVYNDPSWLIAIKPYFVKETKALIGNMYPENPVYIKARNFYRWYLGVYLILLGLLLWA